MFTDDENEVGTPIDVGQRRNIESNRMLIDSEFRLKGHNWKNWKCEDQRAYRRKHLEGIKYAKRMIDNSPPSSMSFLRRNPKREQMIEDRYTEIERANRILLEKMSHIIGSKKFIII